VLKAIIVPKSPNLSQSPKRSNSYKSHKSSKSSESSASSKSSNVLKVLKPRRATPLYIYIYIYTSCCLKVVEALGTSRTVIAFRTVRTVKMFRAFITFRTGNV